MLIHGVKSLWHMRGTTRLLITPRGQDWQCGLTIVNGMQETWGKSMCVSIFVIWGPWYMYGKVSRLAGWIAIGCIAQTRKKGREQTYRDKCTCTHTHTLTAPGIMGTDMSLGTEVGGLWRKNWCFNQIKYLKALFLQLYEILLPFSIYCITSPQAGNQDWYILLISIHSCTASL